MTKARRKEEDVFDKLMTCSLILFSMGLYVSGWVGFVLSIIMSLLSIEVNNWAVLFCVVSIVLGCIGWRSIFKMKEASK